MRRIVVVGTSGSGKTTLARRLAERLGVEHVELDGLHHLPGWRARPTDELRSMLAERIAADGWVVDGNYSSVRDLLWPAADTVVWLDLPRSSVMWQLGRRTVVRVAGRTELWGGNRETLRNVLSRDPERSILRWAWQTHPLDRERYEALMAGDGHPHLRWVRLASRRDADRFLATVDTD